MPDAEALGDAARWAVCVRSAGGDMVRSTPRAPSDVAVGQRVIYPYRTPQTQREQRQQPMAVVVDVRALDGHNEFAVVAHTVARIVFSGFDVHRSTARTVPVGGEVAGPQRPHALYHTAPGGIITRAGR